MQQCIRRKMLLVLGCGALAALLVGCKKQVATAPPADTGWGILPALLLGAAGLGGAIALANERTTSPSPASP